MLLCFITHFVARTPNKYNEFHFNFYCILNMSLLFKTQCITSALPYVIPFKRLYIGILNLYYKYILHLQRTLTDLALIHTSISTCFQNTENYPTCAQRSHPPSKPINPTKRELETILVLFWWDLYLFTFSVVLLYYFYLSLYLNMSLLI